MSGRRGVFLALCLGALAMLGCSKRGTLTGTVTYDGRELEDGWIVLFPSEGNGPATGARIHRGRYTVRDVPPGKNSVRVFGISHTGTDERTRALVFEARAKGQRIPREVAEKKAPPPVPPEASAGLSVEVAAGRQTRDFALANPKAK